MKKIIVVLFIAVLFAGCAKNGLKDDIYGSNDSVRIALGHKIEKSVITCSSAYIVKTCEGSVWLTSADTLVFLSGLKTPQVFINGNKRIKISYYPVTVKPKTSAGLIAINGMVYRGEIFFINDADNYLLPINRLSMEDYLKGVVPAEIGKLSKEMIEAAKAQAVAARTYAQSHLKKNYDMGYDMECTVQDQVYRGFLIESEITNLACDETKGIVALYQGVPIDAKYHSTCGGYTSDNENEWAGAPQGYLRGGFDGEGCLVKSVYCSKSKHYKWTYQYDRQEFFDMVSKNISKLKNRAIKVDNVKITKTDKYKRVVEVTVYDEKNGKFSVRGLDIRKIFSPKEVLTDILKSRKFTIKSSGDKVIIDGGGFGHGVGMCQYGAMEMAKRGKNYKQILKHYYRGIQLKRVY